MKSAFSNPFRTVLIISVGFLILYLVKGFNGALYIAVITGSLGALSVRVSELIDILWKKLTKLLSLIIPTFLLSVVFYLFLFPISLLAKIFKPGNMVQLKNNRDTNWIETNKEFNKIYFEKMW